MAGALVPARFIDTPEDAKPLLFNLFQFDTIEAIVRLCAEEGMRSEDREDYAAGWVVHRTFPPITVDVAVMVLDPDDDERVFEQEVEMPLVPGVTAFAMEQLLDRYVERIRFDRTSHSQTKRSPRDAGANRSEFLAVAPAPGIPLLKHKRLTEVVTELREFLRMCSLSGFTVHF